MPSITTGVKLAPGYFNSANLKFLNQLSPPLFEEYGAGEIILSAWEDVISMELAGDRNWVDVGLPKDVLTLYRVTRADFAYLKANYSGQVTVRLLDQGANAYHIYNAILKPIRVGQDSGTWAADAIGGWSDMKLEFYDLEQIG